VKKLSKGVLLEKVVFFVYMRFSLADKGVHAVLDAEAGLSLTIS
jgi:hypothetical protein